MNGLPSVKMALFIRNGGSRSRISKSLILSNFFFCWHFCKNHICIRLFVQCFQLAQPVIHCRDWNVMFLTPCFASLPTELKFMDSFRPQLIFSSVFIMIQFPSFVMKRVYQKNMGANSYG